MNDTEDREDAPRPKGGMDDGIAWTLVAIGVLLTIGLIAALVTDHQVRFLLAAGPLLASIGGLHLLGRYGTRVGHVVLGLVVLATVAFVALWRLL